MRQRTWTIDKVNAWKKAYGRTAQNREVLWAVLKPGLILGGLSFLLYDYGWLSVCFGLIGGVYGYRVLLPLSARRAYDTRALNERKKFINMMTQLLLNEKRTVLDALRLTAGRLSGELKTDVYQLVTHLYGTTDPEKRTAFLAFETKYQRDIWFAQYVRQLMRASIEGRMDERAFTDLTHFHNDTCAARVQFLQDKQTKASEFVILAFATFGLLLFSAASFGWSTYVQATAHTPLGWIGDSAYLLALAFLFQLWLKRTSDDDNTEVNA